MQGLNLILSMEKKIIIIKKKCEMSKFLPGPLWLSVKTEELSVAPSDSVASPWA